MNLEQEINEIKAMLLKLLADNKEVMNIHELSIYTGIPVATIYRKMDSIPRSKQGKRLFFQKSEIDKWLMSNRRKTNEELEIEAATYNMNRRMR